MLALVISAVGPALGDGIALAVIGIPVIIYGIVVMTMITNRQNWHRVCKEEDEDWSTALEIVADPISNLSPNDTAQIVAVFKAIQHGRGREVTGSKIASIIKRRSFNEVTS